MNARPAVIRRQEATDLDANIGPGEHVLWRGKPERKPFVLRTWPLSIFGAALLLSAIIYEVVILTTEAPDILAYWGIPFTLAALYMIVGHFLVTTLEWRNTEYLITDSRLLISHGIFSRMLTIYSLLSLPHTTLEMRRPDVGNIMFKPPEGQGYGPWPGYQTMWPYTPGYLVGLMYIRNPQRVQQLLENALHS